MGQKLAKERKKQAKRDEERLTKDKDHFHNIIFRNLGIKALDRRIVTGLKAIPVPATKDATRKERFRFKQWKWFKDQLAKVKAHPFFRVKENTYEGQGEDNQYEIEITQENWNRSVHTHLAVYALIINVSNIYRFPQECVRYGGAVFFTAYLFVTVFITQSLIYLETVVGQFSQQGVSGFGSLHPFARGIPQAIIFMSLIFVPYNSVLQAYTFKYVYGSFYNHAGNCTDSWNELDTCVSYNDLGRLGTDPTISSSPIWFETTTQRTSLISTELYFRQFILGHHWNGTRSQEHQGWDPWLYIGLGITYLLVILCTRVRLTSIPSKIIICLSCLLPVFLGVVLASQIFRAGALTGILDLSFFQIAEWTNFLSLPFWSEVFRSAMLTSGVGCGLYSRVSSKNPFTKDSLHRISWLVVLFSMTIAVTSTFILMAELGAIRYAFNGSSYHQIFAEATGSSYAAISGALIMLGGPTALCIFFAASHICCLWSEIVASENCTKQITDYFSIGIKNLRTARYVALGILIVLQGICAIIVSLAGGLILDSFLFDGTWAAAFVSLAEVVSISWLYGTKFFVIDIELMVRHSAPALFRFQLKYFAPIAWIIIFGVMSYTNIRYGEDMYLGVFPIPVPLLGFGYCLNAVPFLIILIWGTSGVFQKKSQGLFWVPAIPYLQGIFGRLRKRRGGIFQAYDTEIIDLTAEFQRRLKQQERAQCLEELRRDLRSIKVSQRARAHWLRLTNKALSSIGRLDSLPRASRWIVRELALKKLRKEVKYIRKVLNSYSLENVFTVPKIEFKRISKDKDDERQRLADVLLNCLPLDDLGYRYAKLTLYERLIGKGNPIPEVDKAFIIMRIKKHLAIDYHNDEKDWLRLSRKDDENRKRHSVFKEDQPLEFYFNQSGVLVRVILFKGTDHSILRTTSRPRPPVIEVTKSQIGKRTGEELLTFLVKLVQQEISQRPKSLAVGLDAASKLNPSRFLTPLANWYHNCDPRRYKISATNTFFVAIVDQLGLQKDRFALILPNETKSVKKYPGERVFYNDYGVYEVTYAKLKPFEDMIAAEEQFFAEPLDSAYDAPRSRSPSPETRTPLSRLPKKSEFKALAQALRPVRRAFSDMDLYYLRRRNRRVSTVFPNSKRFSDSLLAEAKQLANFETDLEESIYTDVRFPLASKGRRVTPTDSDDDWSGSDEDDADNGSTRLYWRTSDAMLTRSKSVRLSEQAMAAWVANAKEKKKAGYNEDDDFFYRRKGKKLIVEGRNGREETSTSDTAIPGPATNFIMNPKPIKK